MGTEVPRSEHAHFEASSFTDRTLAYLLIAPTVTVLLALSIYPLIYSIRISFQTGSGHATFENFTRLFSDQFFLSALLHTFVYAAIALTIEFFIGLGLALLLNEKMRGRNAFRALFLLPMMLPPVVVGVVWRLMLNSNFGALNGTLKGFGVNTEALTWTASPKLAMASVIMADVWQWTPFMFVILLAGLTAIPPNLYEAAELDGVNAWQAFWSITVPQLGSMILLAITFRLLDAVKLFDTIFIMTGGGPGTKTYTGSFYLYTVGFTQFHLSQATAGSWLFLIITALFVTFLVRRLLKAENA